jgi:hypothetical protein
MANTLYPIETAIALDLCCISYERPQDIRLLGAKIRPLVTHGQWHIVWGPVVGKKGNLIYVAAHRAPNSEFPDTYAITVRGTDLDWHIKLNLGQLFEDFCISTQTNAAWMSLSNSKISRGAMKAIQSLQSLCDVFHGKEMTLEEFLTAVLWTSPQEQTPRLLVTGHSLGGCLTLPLSLWIRNKIAPHFIEIHPITFAALSAGNKWFMWECQKAFPKLISHVNNLDVATYCWQSVDKIEHIYTPYHCDMPRYFKFTLKLLTHHMWCRDVQYVGPFKGLNILNGTFYCLPKSPPEYNVMHCPTHPDGSVISWTEQAVSQHHLGNYYYLLGVTPPAL